MAVHFHLLTVKKIIKETPDCVRIIFDVPAALKNEFEFIHGQNVTLKTVIDGEEVRRSYSICTAPHEKELAVAVKKVAGGKFSTYANEYLQNGMAIEVLSPTGKFNTPLKKENKKNYVAFTAGSGITPIISIIKTTLATEPASTFTLVYSNRSRSSIIFFEELEGLKNKYLQRFHLINMLSREKTDAAINYGRINTEKLTTLTRLINYKLTDEFFICGPQVMIFCVKDFLEQQGIDKKKIHFELFAAVKKTNIHQPQHVVSQYSTPKSSISIKSDGRSFYFDLAFDSSSILDAALKEGADLPFACKGGVCCTCKAKLIEGEVAMDVNWGLEQEEAARGFILTCQSHPITEKVVIDFDAR